jgi:hypothetical protein
VLDHALGHVDGAGDVDGDEPEVVVKVVVDEGAAQPDPHVERGRG